MLYATVANELRRDQIRGLPLQAPVARVAIWVPASSFFDGAALSFKFYRSDRITWHLHFFEPCCQGLLIRGLHDADDFSLRQVGKTSIRLHRRVVLGDFSDLVDLFAREGASRNGMAAHELSHNICSFFGLLFWCGGFCGWGLEQMPNKFPKWWQRRGVSGKARRQVNPHWAWLADATQPETPHRASPFPSNPFRSAWEAARAEWPVCGVRGRRPRSTDIGLCLFLADRSFRLSHLEISFGICSRGSLEESIRRDGWQQGLKKRGKIHVRHRPLYTKRSSSAVGQRGPQKAAVKEHVTLRLMLENHRRGISHLGGGQIFVSMPSEVMAAEAVSKYAAQRRASSIRREEKRRGRPQAVCSPLRRVKAQWWRARLCFPSRAHGPAVRARFGHRQKSMVRFEKSFLTTGPPVSCQAWIAEKLGMRNAVVGLDLRRR